MRVGAAGVVFLSHAAKPGIADDVLPNATQFGIDAVTAFFVLSGFVISYTAQNKETKLSEFLIARLARLWSVALPALALSAVLEHYGTRIAPNLYLAGDTDLYGGSTRLSELISAYPLLRVIFGILFINEAWSLTIIEFGNPPYWSLSYEFCYYLLFAAFFYLNSWSRAAIATLVILIFGPKILLLLPVWLLGAILQRVNCTVPHRFAWPCIIVPIALYLIASYFDASRRSWWFDQHMPFAISWSMRFVWRYFVGALVSINIIGVASLPSRNLISHFEGPIKTLSSQTLSIYLFHFPILWFLSAVLTHQIPPHWRGAVIIGATLVSCSLLSRVTEAQKSRWRRALTTVYRTTFVQVAAQSR